MTTRKYLTSKASRALVLFAMLGSAAGCSTSSTHTAENAQDSNRAPASVSAEQIQAALESVDQDKDFKIFISTANALELFDGEAMKIIPDNSSDTTYLYHADNRSSAGKKRLVEILSKSQNSCIAKHLVSITQLIASNKTHFLKVAHRRFLRAQQEMAALKKYSQAQAKAGLPYYGSPIRDVKEAEFMSIPMLIKTEAEDQLALADAGKLAQVDFFKEPLREIQTWANDRIAGITVLRGTWGQQRASQSFGNWFEWESYVKNRLAGVRPNPSDCKMSKQGLDFLIGD